MPLGTEVVGALGAVAIALVVAWRFRIDRRRAVAALAVVPLVLAGVLATPALRDGIASLRAQHRDNAPLTSYQAEVWGGVEFGVAVDFLAWVEEQFAAGDTFHLTVGTIPGETYVGGVGVRQASILQWSLFQLAPHIAVEQSPKARDIEPDEGLNADWLVFYESNPAEHAAGPLNDVRTYAPGFAIARTDIEG